MSIRQAFNACADHYDSERKILIPCFDEFYGSALEILDCREKLGAVSILDMGAGTGLFSSLVDRLFPDAELTLIDISEKMLEKARKRFTGRKAQVNYITMDYSNEAIEGNFDIIISALSIHHLGHSEKERLFQKLFSNLNDNGLFINADQVLGETPEIDAVYRSLWIKQVKEKGATDAMLAAAFERMKEDNMSPLSDQLNWLGTAGFSDVNCWYKNFSFAVYSGFK